MALKGKLDGWRCSKDVTKREDKRGGEKEKRECPIRSAGEREDKREREKEGEEGELCCRRVPYFWIEHCLTKG